MPCKAIGAVWSPRNFAQQLGMAINWVRIYNRLFNLIDRHGESYFSAGRFIQKVREVDPYFPNYKQYMDERRAKRISTSRKDYFYEILLQFDEAPRMRIISGILDKVEHCDADLGAEIRSLMGRPGNHQAESCILSLGVLTGSMIILPRWTRRLPLVSTREPSLCCIHA